MDRLMFWKKKKKPEDSTAQHLANLIGTSVAGFIPQPPNDKVDLDVELSVRHNTAIASLVVISALVKGNQTMRQTILGSIRPEHFGARSFENYVFQFISDELRDQGNISLDRVEKRIPEYGQVVYGEPSSQRSLEGDFFRWNQILSFKPTDEQINRALEYLQERARDKGLLDKG